jgi:hypothetical protein
MSLKLIKYQFGLGVALGMVIACSPTKFTPSDSATAVCDSTVTTCVVEQGGYTNITQPFEVGAGKVDILFVDDNSASMYPVQVKLKDRFSGFLQNLDSKKIDYRVAVTTTDLTAVNSQRLIKMGNGKTYLSNTGTGADSAADRPSLFYSAILRTETLNCENFIIAMFNTYGNSFQSQADYAAQYPTKCPAPDTRGIYTSFLVVSENSDLFLRDDANLNVIAITNDEERQGRYAFETNDRADNFISMMQQKHPNKYWDYNSIIVKDNTCRDQQVLKTAQGQTVMGQNGPAVIGGIAYEYARLSNSAAKDIDNNPRPRGMILDICQDDYASHFSNMATQISQESRMITLKCSPSAAPVVNYQNGTSVPSSLYTWSGNKITFQRGSEGSQVTIQYKCYSGVQ